VRLDPELKRALLIGAAEEHVSVSEVIRRAISETYGPADHVPGAAQ
jgi:predicted HicB family RNase H-like nuclease